MDKNELERRLEAAEKQNLGLLDEIKWMKEELAEMQDKQEIPDKPVFEMCDKFYYLDSATDDVKDGSLDGDIDLIDFNMFHTREYAHEFRRKCLLIAMMLHCKWHIDRDYVPDWDNCDDKFTVWYNRADNVWTIDFHEIHEAPTIYFSTEEAAQKCADWLNRHWSGCDD